MASMNAQPPASSVDDVSQRASEMVISSSSHDAPLPSLPSSDIPATNLTRLFEYCDRLSNKPHHEYRDEDLYEELDLTPPEWLDLLNRLDNDWHMEKLFRNALRYCYNSLTCKIIIQKNSDPHTWFVSAFEHILMQGLWKLEEQHPQLASYISNIKGRRSEMVHLDMHRWSEQQGADQVPPEHRKLSHRRPDTWFCHRDIAYHATVIVEVAYARSHKSLVDGARDFIYGDPSGVQTVIGIKMDHGRSEKAWISVLRPHITKTPDGRNILGLKYRVKERLWRNEDKSPVHDMPPINIPLTYFLSKEIMPDPELRAIAKTAVISITSEKLCAIMDDIDYMEERRDVRRPGLPVVGLKRPVEPVEMPQAERDLSDEEDDTTGGPSCKD